MNKTEVSGGRFKVILSLLRGYFKATLGSSLGHIWAIFGSLRVTLGLFWGFWNDLDILLPEGKTDNLTD